MSRKSRTLSYCIGIYNEDRILLSSIKRLQIKLTETFGRNNFEILLIDNGSTDNTAQIFNTLKKTIVKTLTIKKKGHGLALKTGIENARYNTVLLTAIDLPFDFSDLEQFMKHWDSYDMIFGSKAHLKSKTNTPLVRSLSSSLYRILIRQVLHVPINDPQGTIFLKKNKVLPFLQLCDAPTAFFTTQLALYASRCKLKICEVPVIMNRTRKRQSKYNVLTDGTRILFSLLRETLKKKDVKNINLSTTRTT